MEDAMNQPDVIDHQRMKDLADTLGRALCEVIDSYMEDTPARIADLEEAFARGNYQGVKDAAHTVKSSSGIFGASQMVSLCRALEDDPNVNIGETIAAISAAYAKVKAVLNLYRNGLSTSERE
jgi:HPt (histidine-containing phosphotransfer) domain-containing protein